MKAYYVQTADTIYPIYGVNSLDEAKEYLDPPNHGQIVETSENVYMNPATGSVDFASGWDSLDGLIQVRYDLDKECWVED